MACAASTSPFGSATKASPPQNPWQAASNAGPGKSILKSRGTSACNHRMPIQTIAIIGAGVPGRAIAQIALCVGCRVVLEDFSIRTLEEAKAAIRETLGENSDKSAQPDQPQNLTVCVGIEDAIRDA